MRYLLIVMMLVSTSLLAGCVNPDDGSVSASPSTSVTPPNHAPSILVNHAYSEDPTVNYSSTYNQSLPVILSMINYTTIVVYHAVVDIDGDNLSMGYDLDLDGHIDVYVNQHSGYTNVSIPTSLWNQHPMSNTSYRISIAFIAIDEHGLGSSDFVDSGIDISPLRWWHDDAYLPNLLLYQFTGEDDSGNPGTDANDYLIRITMDQGKDIGWSAISVKIEIDGGVPQTCDNPGIEGTAPCMLEEFGTDTTDTVLSAGDGFRIKENGQDLCNTACSIDVTITDTREGKIIDTTNDVAAE